MTASVKDYTVMSTIGTGSFGVCRKIKRKSDGVVLVWKELDYGQMSEKEKHMLVSEVNIMREFRSPHIVKYYDRIIDRTNTTIYIIMEYCPNGDLAALIKKARRDRKYLDESMIWRLFTQVILAVQECHERKEGMIMHRDIKPANIFLDSARNVKLGDFGLARVLNSGSFAKTFVGTPYYMSPEQCQSRPYTSKSDIWSLGCLLYELAALSPPFDAANQQQLAVKIKIGKFKRLSSQYSEDMNRTVRKMLLLNSRDRPSIEELKSTVAPIKKCLESRTFAAEEKRAGLRQRGQKVARPSTAGTASSKEVDYQKRLEALEQKEIDLNKREKDLKAREVAVRRRELDLNIKEKAQGRLLTKGKPYGEKENRGVLFSRRNNQINV